MSQPVRVLFVCLGNICRSPTAHGVFENLVREAGLSHRIEVDSSGTGDWHVGLPPDKRAVAEAKGRGYDLSQLRARQVCPADFEQFDLVVAMDRSNLADLKALQTSSARELSSAGEPSSTRAEVRLFLEFAAEAEVDEVPDPYFGGADGFAHVFELVESASRGLLSHLQQRYPERLGTGRSPT